MTITVHGIKTPAELTIYFDTEPHQSKLSQYPFRAIAKGEKPIHLPDGRKIYHLELTNLQPNQRYFFTVGDRFRSFCSEKSFQTLPNDDTPLIFVEGGDWENTPGAKAVAKQAALQNPHLILLGGDYPSHVNALEDYLKWDEWLEVYAHTMVRSDGCMIPFVAAIGNHEVVGGFDKTKEDAPFFFHYFRQGETKESYFFLPLGEKVCLFILDSGHAASQDGKQLEWLQEELAKAKNIPIKIAVYHVPLFPSVRFAEKDLIYHSVYSLVELCHDKNSANKLFSNQSNKGRKYWLPLFDQNNLTVAFEHHDQTLKRTKLLKGGKEDRQGTLYLGDGGWGPDFQYPPIQGYFHKYFAALRGKVHFFWLMKIDRNQISYQAISANGEILDQFVQECGF